MSVYGSVRWPFAEMLDGCQQKRLASVWGSVRQLSAEVCRSVRQLSAEILAGRLQKHQPAISVRCLSEEVLGVKVSVV